jgi:hypothetical protein
VEAAELGQAFSVRVIMVGSEDRAVAKTREALVQNQNQNSKACSSLAGIPTAVHAKTAIDKLTFNWNEPTCEDSATNVLGYEYAVSVRAFLTIDFQFFRSGRRRMGLQKPHHLCQKHRSLLTI